MRRLIALLASALITCTAYATPPSDESIHDLLAITKTEKLVDSVLENLDQMFRQSMIAAFKGQKPTPEQQAVLDKATARFINVMREEMAWENMRAMYVQLYKETFTQEEIDGLIAFYKTPTGIAFIDKMPVVMQKSMIMTQARLAAMRERIKAAIQQAIVEARTAKVGT